MERKVTVLSDIKDLGELLGGSRVEQARLLPSNGALQLVLDFTRAMPERASAVRQGFVKKVRTPFTKCQLTLGKVRQAAVKRVDDPASEQPLLSCDAITGGYQLTVQTPDGLQLVLQLEQLTGAFADVGEPIETP